MMKTENKNSRAKTSLNGKSTMPKNARSARGTKARGKLKIAAMKALEKVGYNQLRVIDVTEEAGVAAGLFYHYFDDLKTLTLEVLTDFLARFTEIETGKNVQNKDDLFALYLEHFELAVKNYSRHPGLMRCLLQFSDQVPEFHELRRESTQRQMNWLAKALPKMFPESGLAEEEAMLMVGALAGMSEILLRNYYITKDPALRACKLTNSEMAEFLTVMFYRGLMLESPPTGKLRFSGKLAKVSQEFLLPRITQTA